MGGGETASMIPQLQNIIRRRWQTTAEDPAAFPGASQISASRTRMLKWTPGQMPQSRKEGDTPKPLSRWGTSHSWDWAPGRPLTGPGGLWRRKQLSKEVQDRHVGPEERGSGAERKWLAGVSEGGEGRAGIHSETNKTDAKV